MSLETFAERLRIEVESRGRHCFGGLMYRYVNEARPAQ